MQLTNQELCSYFRQFGAIERVQILPERFKLWDLIPPLDEQRQNDAKTKKYFAYVTFVNCLGAVNALNVHLHEINDIQIIVIPAFSWHQPCAENVILPTPNTYASADIVELREQIYDCIDVSLNDDCIATIMSYFNVYELIDLARHNPRFAYLSQQQRSIHILPNLTPNGRELTLLNLRQILRLQGFGYSALDVTISAKAFKYGHTSSKDFINKMVQYIGPQLRSFSLRSFNVNTMQFAKLKSIILNLQHLEIDLNYDDFNYEEFNDIWPNLQSLRLESSGAIRVVEYKSEKATAFPKLTSLIIISRYKLYEHLFENIADTFSTLKSLVIISIGDYYTDLNATIQTDFAFVAQMEHLKKLHISFGQNYLNDDIWKTLGRMGSLEHLTVEVTSQRSDYRAVLSDANFNAFRRGLINLADFRISGFGLNENRTLDIIRYASYMDTFYIQNSGLEISSEFIRELVAARIAQISRRNAAPLTGKRAGNGEILHLMVEQQTHLTRELVCNNLLLIKYNHFLINSDYTEVSVS